MLPAPRPHFKRESDAWYVDLPGYSCPLESAGPENISDGKNCSDTFQLQTTGKPETGFAVKETMTLTMNGQPPLTITSETIELSQTELDEVLFDVPEGYEEDRNSAAPEPTLSSSDDQTRGLGLAQITDASTVAAAQVVSETQTAPGATSPAPALGSKQPGAVRVGVALPEVQTPDSKSDPSAGYDIAAAARESLMSALKWCLLVARRATSGDLLRAAALRRLGF